MSKMGLWILTRRGAVIFTTLMLGINGFSQSYYCKQSVLNAVREIPKLTYDCPGSQTDSDESILKMPERVKALRKFAGSLETFNSPAWWAATIDDITYCDIHKKAGRLTKDEVSNLHGGEYYYKLFGSHKIRIVKTPDPCYQTGYGGSDMFLIYRPGTRVYATEIIDGFYSRADNPIFANFAMLGSESLVEVATSTGGLYPMLRYYYFAIDERTKRAVPKNLFRDEKGRTNEIWSMMLLGDAEEYGLPPKTEPLVIFKNGRMRKSFIVLDDTEKRSADDNHAVFVKKVLHWNGEYFK